MNISSYNLIKSKVLIPIRNFRNWIMKFILNDYGTTMTGLTPVILFILTILLYSCYMMVMQPNMVLGGAMWAEMATNYFPNANSPSYLKKIFSTDAGYIPLLPRLIALIGNQLNFPAAAIPYFYSWSAVIGSSILVGSFCLPQFRKLIKSDSLRFVTCLAVLMLADFETRTFINFSYNSAFFIAIITSLAIVNKVEDVPRWAWTIPILIISKPSVLAALPAMILVAFISKSRFRWITFFATVTSTLGVIQLLMSLQAGVFLQANNPSLISKLTLSVQFFFGFLGAYSTGQLFQLNTTFLMLCGLGVFVLGLFVFFYTKSNSRVLIIMGFLLLYGNVLLNVFALSDVWNADMGILSSGTVRIYRDVIVGFHGCLLVMCGLFSSLRSNEFIRLSKFLNGIPGALIFLIWFAGMGYLSIAGRISREPSSPTIYNSQWQSMASSIDSRLSPLCVPIDPWWKGANWMYGINCGLLKVAPAWEDGVALISTPLFFDTKPTNSIFEKKLIAAAILVRPFSNQKTFIEAQMLVKLVDGSYKYYSGSRYLIPSGGLLLLTGKDIVPIKNIASVRVIFNLPVEVALDSDDGGKPGIAWLGN
jgi:hypothetical protein